MTSLLGDEIQKCGSIVCFSHRRLGVGCVFLLLFHLESSVGCPGNSLVLSHGVVDDFHPGSTNKSRQRKVGILQDALISGNCYLIMGLSIHLQRTPSQCCTSTWVTMELCCIRAHSSPSQGLLCRCPQGILSSSRAIAGRAWGNWSPMKGITDRRRRCPGLLTAGLCNPGLKALHRGLHSGWG